MASEQSDGDLHPERVRPSELAARQMALAGARVAMVDQVHGIAVHHVAPGFDWPVAGRADVLVAKEVPIGIWAADCASIFLVGTAGTLVAAHGGWRGLAAGVIDVAVDQFNRCTSPGELLAVTVVGPVIHPCCYEFDAADVAAVARGVHADAAAVAGTTSAGRPGLDVPAALRAGLQEHGIDIDVIGPCTGCGGNWFSHRVRKEAGRHAVLGWSERLPA